MALNNEFKAAKSDLVRSNQVSQKSIVKLSNGGAENEFKLHQQNQAVEILKADYHASAEETTRLKRDLDVPEARVTNLQK